ncbi:hypothetical protein HZS_5789, partial [Henneguya salminicola]
MIEIFFNSETSTGERYQFSATLLSESSKYFSLKLGWCRGKIIIKVITTVEASIGQYCIDVCYKNYKAPIISFILIFNPYNILDTTYIMETEHYDQYLLNKQASVYFLGKITSKSLRFFLNQFSEQCASVAINIIKQMKFSDRADSVQVSRFISKWVNSNGIEGMIVINYEEMSLFTKIPENPCLYILEKFAKKMVPVGYGQCIDCNVILCSLMRMLGIGCRLVTGFNILRILPPYSKDYICLNRNRLELIEDEIETWRFHVWCNIYIRRPDLKNNYVCFDGWQYLDGATYQENSGFIPCGPLPIKSLFNQRNPISVFYERTRIEYYFRNYINIYLINDESSVESKTFLLLQPKPILTEDPIGYHPMDLKSEYNYYVPPRFSVYDKEIRMRIYSKDKIYFTESLKIIFEIITPVIRTTKIKIIVSIEANDDSDTNTLICQEFHDCSSLMFEYIKSFSFVRCKNNSQINLILIDMYYYDPYNEYIKYDSKTVK